MKADPAVTRLSAGLDRDEQLARAAASDEMPLPIGWRDPQVAARWKYSEFDEDGRVVGQVQCLDMRILRGAANTQKRHIAEFDPARALRQADAFRKVLERHAEAERDSVLSDRDAGFEAGLYAALECLASIYDEATDGGKQP